MICLVNDWRCDMIIVAFRTPYLGCRMKKGHRFFVFLTAFILAALVRASDYDYRPEFGITKEKEQQLINASRVGAIEIISELLKDKEINVNVANEGGWTPLQEAAENGHLKIVQLLLTQGADIDKQDNMGRTALYWAAKQGRTEVVTLLLKNNANVNLLRESRDSVLHVALPHPAVVKLLLETNINVNQLNDSGVTPLYLAVRFGYLDTIKLLLAKKADVNLGDSYGTTPLHLAAYYGHPEVVKWLLEHHARPNQRNRMRATALDYAKQYNEEEVIKILEEKTRVTFGEKIRKLLQRSVQFIKTLLKN
jgi:ankyrin repeat protein